MGIILLWLGEFNGVKGVERGVLSKMGNVYCSIILQLIFLLQVLPLYWHGRVDATSSLEPAFPLEEEDVSALWGNVEAQQG